MTTRLRCITHRGRALWALALAAAAAMTLLVGAAPADAAPPTLTASENPVVFPLSATTKNISVNWNLNGYQGSNIILNIHETGGALLSKNAVTTPTGSVPLTATYGKSYTATLSDLAAGQVATLQITTKRLDIVLPSGGGSGPSVPTIPGLADCVLYPCISGVVFSPYGSYAEFTVKTTKPANFQMAICGSPFRDGGACSRPVSGMFNVLFTTNWSSHVTGLTHNMMYHYLVTATDQDGHETTKTGTFRTLRRKVEVAVDEIAVTNDSDDWSACDCSFTLEVDGKRDYWPGDVGGVHIATGEAVNPPLRVTVMDGDDTLTLRVFGLDNDKTGSIFQSCGGGTPELGWGVGSNACWDWATATRSFNVAASGFSEEFGDSFYKRAEGGPLTFRVLVSFKVTYVP